MSQQTPIIPVSKDPITIWYNRVSNAIPTNKLGIGDGYRLSQTSQGTVLLFDQEQSNTIYVNERGEYDTTFHYAPGDDVYVLPNKTYTSSLGNDVSASAGSWRCECVIPNSLVSDALIAAGLTGSTYSQYIRTGSINYAPIWPMPTNMATSNTSGGRYWRLIGMLPITMSVCENNVGVIYYIGAQKSGSIA
jgi:hypothetical protein